MKTAFADAKRISLPAILLLSAALALLSAGCVKLFQPHPEKRYFVIHVARPGPPANPSPTAAGRILEVRKFRVKPHYEGRGLVYRKADDVFESDFYNEFFVSTHDMFTEETRRWLGDSGLFEHVVDTASRIEATHLVEGSLTTLYGDFTDKEKPKAVLEIQFLLIDDGGTNPKIIAPLNYRIESPLTGNTPDALVAGFTKALEEILTNLENDLRKKLP